MEEEEKRLVAYHESGHAVAQYELGWELLLVGIGHVHSAGQKWVGASNGNNKSTPAAAVIAYAGPLAEAKSLGVDVSDKELVDGSMPHGLQDLGGWKFDADKARRFAGAEGTARHAASARDLINRPEVWLAISTVANELCRTTMTRLRDIPADVRSVVFGEFDASMLDRLADYHYFKGDDAVRIVRSCRVR